MKLKNNIDVIKVSNGIISLVNLKCSINPQDLSFFLDLNF